MNALDPELGARIKSAIPIDTVIGRYVRLRKHGTDLKGLCPFHKERTPSFNVNTRTQAYKCFGCGVSGDVITFVREIEGMSFREAVEMLAGEAGIDIEAANRAAIEDHKRKRALAGALAKESREFWSMVVRQLWWWYRQADQVWCRIEQWAHTNWAPGYNIDAPAAACYAVQSWAMNFLEAIWAAAPESLIRTYQQMPRKCRQYISNRVKGRDRVETTIRELASRVAHG